MSWCWLGFADGPVSGALAAAEAADLDDGAVRTMVAWPAGARRPPGADRVDGRVIDSEGPRMAVSLTLAPDGVAYDDPAVIAATRAALDGPAPALLSTLSRDPVHIAGALRGVVPSLAEAWPGWWEDDPFLRVFSQRRLLVGPGLFGPADPPPGPVHQRYGGAPWPVAGFRVRGVRT